jgi:adenosylhomocysteine nucleosidase
MAWISGQKLIAFVNRTMICVGFDLEAAIASKEIGEAIRPPQDCAELKLVERAISNGCAAIVSLGLSGGLVSGLRPGDVVVASRVIDGQISFQTDDRWSSKLLSAISLASYAPIVGSDLILTNIGDRAELRFQSGAVAVDTESHLVARLAAAHSLRLVALRVILDASDRTVPPVALACVAEDRRTSIGKLARELVSQPAQAGDVVRLWGDWMKARKKLAHCSQVVANAVRELDCRSEE